MKRETIQQAQAHTSLRASSAFWFACCFLCLTWAWAFAAVRPALARDAEAVSVTAAVEKETVSLGEPFLLKIQVEGADLPSGGTGPDMGAVADFSVESLGSRGNNSSSITIVNGRMTRMETHGHVYTYRLTPKKTGQFTIPAIPLAVDARTYSTQPIRMSVVQPQTTQDFQLKVDYSKTRFYVGEPILVTVTWYLGRDVENGSFNLPMLEIDGFTLTDPKLERDPNRQYFQIPLGGSSVLGERGRGVLNDREYTTISFKKVLLAARPGDFQVPEATVSCRALVGYSRKDKRQSPFSGFLGDDFFNFGQKGVYKTFVARSRPAALTVLPLPEEGKPAHFSGAVGSFRIETTASPTDVSVGDPITLTTSITGSNYLDNVELPPLSTNAELTRDFRIPEEMAAGVVKDGAKIFTQTLRANNETVKSIPPITLAYFDPDLGQYREAASRTIPLQVKAARVVTAEDLEGRIETTHAKSELESWSRGIAHNYEGPDVLENRRFRLSTALRSVFWLSGLILPLAGFLALLFVTKHREKKTADPDEYRSRKAMATFKRSLSHPSSPSSGAAGQDGDECESVLRAVQNYLGDKLKTHGGALTFIDTESRLRERGVDPDTIARLGKIFAACEQGRYGGGYGPGKSSAELRQEVLVLIETLDRKIR
jgi:hypothetical protein